MRRFILFFASVGFIGYVPFAPGTAGTLAGVLMVLFFSNFPWFNYLLGTISFFFLSCWAADRAEVIWGQRDSPRIVIDELVGFLVTMALVPKTRANLLWGFLFFRLFDIIKPFPIGWIHQHMKGGWAVVLDDVMAGLYANLLLQVIVQWDPQIFSLVRSWLLRAV